jgi:hypothetical protein
MQPGRTGVLAAAVLAVTPLAPAAGAVEAGDATAPFSLPKTLPVAAEVKDPAFAILVGLLETNSYGALTREHLDAELARRKARSRLPYKALLEVKRLPVEPGKTALVTATFQAPLKLPIPYTILWYHPGSLETERACVFREWILGDVRLPVTGSPRESDLELRDVHLFGLAAGRLEVDIDGWLDRLMGAALDDTGVTGLLVFRHRGRRLGMAVGYNADRRGRSGAFDFAADKVLFPTPRELLLAGRQMRSRMEALMAGAGAVPAPVVPVPAR